MQLYMGGERGWDPEKIGVGEVLEMGKKRMGNGSFKK